VTVDFNREHFLTEVFEKLVALPGDPEIEIDRAVDDVIDAHARVLRRVVERHREEILWMVDEYRTSRAVAEQEAP
jgi:hypothetical protein